MTVNNNRKVLLCGAEMIHRAISISIVTGSETTRTSPRGKNKTAVYITHSINEAQSVRVEERPRRCAATPGVGAGAAAAAGCRAAECRSR